MLHIQNNRLNRDTRRIGGLETDDNAGERIVRDTRRIGGLET